MSYRVRFTCADGSHGWLGSLHRTKEDAERHIRTQLSPNTCFTYTVDEFPDVSTAAVLDASPSVGVMPRRVWQEQRIRALGEAIVRRMGHEYPTVASVFDLAHIRDWAAEIVELCERDGGQQAKPSDAEAIRRLEAYNQELRERLAVAQRQRDEAVAALAKEQKP